MKMKLGLALLFVSLLAMCYPRTFEASATLPENVTLTFSVKPMFSLQSDWTRKVVIKRGGEKIELPLSEDTGWWRGSHLYRHASGAYVIHEGQDGCFGFTLDPLSFDIQTRISCRKHEGLPQNGDGASPYYADLIYLGAFVETPNSADGSPIRFLSPEERAEVELPDIL